MEHDRVVFNASVAGDPMTVLMPTSANARSVAGAAAVAQDRRIVLYDTTLRDGAQMQGVDFSAIDKQVIAAELDRLGIDYVEGGWPGANPTDDAFFADPPPLGRATLTAFGMTRRPGRSAANDPGLRAVLHADTAAVCLVGKASHLAAEQALGITPAENLDLIGESLAAAVGSGREVLFDAEHFFDGYKLNPDYALSCLRRAQQEGASWLVLCDTNGGTLPEEISSIVSAVVAAFPGLSLGIHTHNDTETAVAGSLAAVAAGARMVQGTLNGLGERCGNANLISLIPTLMLKLGYHTGVSEEGLCRLTQISRMVDERLNRVPNFHAAYVGKNAFAHKAGLHASAVARNSTTYEHVAPECVGNRRHVVISNQAGRANLLSRLSEIGIAVAADDARLPALLEILKRREFEGYVYDSAEASFELLARSAMGETPEFYRVVSLHVSDDQVWDEQGVLVSASKATVNVELQGETRTAVAEGADSLTALDMALRNVLLPSFPVLQGMRSADYQVRVYPAREAAKQPVTRVMINSQDLNEPSLGRWSTVGVSTNLIDACYSALHDAIIYRLFRALSDSGLKGNQFES
jgi:2-isopropylmalate synthase